MLRYLGVDLVDESMKDEVNHRIDEEKKQVVYQVV